jgi:CO/xanthine dehydrogenase Mo-binding subunit
VSLDIEPPPVVADRRASMRNDVRLIDGTESNWAAVYTANAGDVERVFRNAAYTRREQFRVQRMTRSGPSATVRIRVEQDGSFAVYVGSSGVGQGVETIMAQLRIAPSVRLACSAPPCKHEAPAIKSVTTPFPDGEY